MDHQGRVNSVSLPQQSHIHQNKHGFVFLRDSDGRVCGSADLHAEILDLRAQSLDDQKLIIDDENMTLQTGHDSTGSGIRISTRVPRSYSIFIVPLNWVTSPVTMLVPNPTLSGSAAI
jgi:hypothetical protein